MELCKSRRPNSSKCIYNVCKERNMASCSTIRMWTCPHALPVTLASIVAGVILFGLMISDIIDNRRIAAQEQQAHAKVMHDTAAYDPSADRDAEGFARAAGNFRRFDPDRREK